MAYMLEIINDEELVDLLISTANEVSVVSESNFLASVRKQLMSRLTRRALDEGGYCACEDKEKYSVLAGVCSNCKRPRQ